MNQTTMATSPAPPHSLIQGSTPGAKLDKEGQGSNLRKSWVKKKKKSVSKDKGKGKLVGAVKEYYEHDHRVCMKARIMAEEKAEERRQERFLESMGAINGSNEHLWDDPPFEFPSITLESLLEQLKTTVW